MFIKTNRNNHMYVFKKSVKIFSDNVCYQNTYWWITKFCDNKNWVAGWKFLRIEHLNLYTWHSLILNVKIFELHLAKIALNCQTICHLTYFGFLIFFACSGTVLYSCDHAWSQIKTGGCFCFFFGGKPLKSPEKG